MSGLCDCDGFLPDSDVHCDGRCCGIGNCVCTPEVLERFEVPSTDELVDMLLHNDNDGAREWRQIFGLPGDPL
jgi:hypothetical protein